MLGRFSLSVVCGVLLSACLATEASAQIGIGPGAYGLGFFNYDTNRHGGSYYRVPYYSLFPPVYYSYPVPRTYGYSPFAYPPGTITPAAAPQVAAIEYINPFVRPDAEPAGNDAGDRAPKEDATTATVAPPVDATASQPRMYYNPFVQTAHTASTR
jgi:hypothetical protein